MTEAKALVLLAIGTMLLTTVLFLSMVALGIRDVALSLSFLLPAALAGDGVGRIVTHYGRVRRGESASRRR